MASERVLYLNNVMNAIGSILMHRYIGITLPQNTSSAGTNTSVTTPPRSGGGFPPTRSPSSARLIPKNGARARTESAPGNTTETVPSATPAADPPAPLAPPAQNPPPNLSALAGDLAATNISRPPPRSAP